MANSKISALPLATTPLAGTEVLPVVQGGVTEQVSVANLTAGRDVSASGLFVDANSATDAVRITQLGAGNALLVEDATNPDSTPFVIDASGTVIQGYTSALTVTDYVGVSRTPRIQEAGLGGSPSQAYISSWSNSDTQAAGVIFGKSKSGTVGTAGAVTSGTDIGFIQFSGDDGTNMIRAALILAEVDGTPGTNDMPGRLVFSTTADGASSPTERVRITSTGSVGIGGAGSVDTALLIQSNITGGAANSYAYRLVTNALSDVTGTATGYFSSIGTQAATFTLTNMRHFAALQRTIGASSTVTNQFGFFADAGLIGATNNYGFYGNIPAAANRYNFYAAGTAQNLFSGDVLVFGAGGMGYSTGSGGAVTQGTSRTTGVTLNKTNGAITLFTAAGSITATTFTVTNSTVAATDVVNVCQKSGTNLYNTFVTAVAAGSFDITFFTTGGIASDAPVFNFAVTKAVTA